MTEPAYADDRGHRPLLVVAGATLALLLTAALAAFLALSVARAPLDPHRFGPGFSLTLELTDGGDVYLGRGRVAQGSVTLDRDALVRHARRVAPPPPDLAAAVGELFPEGRLVGLANGLDPEQVDVADLASGALVLVRRADGSLDAVHLFGLEDEAGDALHLLAARYRRGAACTPRVAGWSASFRRGHVVNAGGLRSDNRSQRTATIALGEDRELLERHGAERWWIEAFPAGSKDLGP